MVVNVVNSVHLAQPVWVVEPPGFRHQVVGQTVLIRRHLLPVRLILPVPLFIHFPVYLLIFLHNQLIDPPYGTTRNFWDVPLPLPELWEAVKWAVKPEGAVLFFAQCPYDKVLGASNLPMLRYEWVWYKSRCTGFLNARRAPLKKTENILVFYQKLPLYNPQFEQGKPYKKIAGNRGDSTNYGKFLRSGSGSEDGLRFPGNVLAFPTVQRTIHPTQKPVELCEYFIKTYTRPGEVVADICAGSGTTAVAALNTSRRFICFETVPTYYAAASERIRAARAAVEAGEKGV